jgi:hypothetical protein
MKNQIKVLLLINNDVLISKIEEISADIGEPDCKLTDPYEIKTNKVLEPFLIDYTKQNIFMINSEKILTIVDPTPTLLEKYEDLIKE